MRVGIVPFGNIEMPSSRMRCFWVAKYWDDATVLDAPDHPIATDVVIFQKGCGANVAEQARRLKAQARNVIWDLCDPDWWFFPKEHAEVADHVDAVVCSTRALAEEFAAEFPRHSPRVIADRQDPTFHPTIKEHAPTESPVLLWFGWAQNRIALHGTFGVLERCWAHGGRFTLLILDDAPESKMDWFNFPVLHREWTLDRFHADLLSADIALLPPYPGPIGVLKSDNKRATAMWAGLPVTDGFDYSRLRDLVDSAHERQRAGLEGRRIAESRYDVRQSVEEWKQVINSLC